MEHVIRWIKRCEIMLNRVKPDLLTSDLTFQSGGISDLKRVFAVDKTEFAALLCCILRLTPNISLCVSMLIVGNLEHIC